jgi:hypothetical protein
MVLNPNQKDLMIGLAGYISEQPTYRFVQRIYGDPDMGYILDYPRNYYLSGMEHPTATAAALIGRRGADHADRDGRHRGSPPGHRHHLHRAVPGPARRFCRNHEADQSCIAIGR